MTDFVLGRHAAQIEYLTVEMAALRSEVSDIAEFVASVKGGWKTAAGMLTMAGAFVGAIFAFIANVALNLIGKASS